jgi:hypothetical protein
MVGFFGVTLMFFLFGLQHFVRQIFQFLGVRYFVKGDL